MLAVMRTQFTQLNAAKYNDYNYVMQQNSQNEIKTTGEKMYTLWNIGQKIKYQTYKNHNNKNMHKKIKIKYQTKSQIF